MARQNPPKNESENQSENQPSSQAETAAQRAEVEQGWYDEYQPEGYAEERLVGILIDNDLLYKQASRRLEEAESSPAGDAALDRLMRAKIRAEQSFYRAWNAVQRLRKDRMRMDKTLRDLRRELDLARAEHPVPKTQPKTKADEPKTAAQQLFQGQNHPKKRKKITVLDQWVEVEIVDGKTITTLYPSNEELIKYGQEMLPPPEMIYRRFHFVDGVPPEYDWTTGNAKTREIGGAGIQRMTVDTWLEVIEREKASGTGHLGPCGGNLPRPEERGGCDCELCTQNRAVLEAA